MTDPLAVIAGISLGAYRRARNPVDRRGWTVSVIPSEKEGKHDLRGIWKKVMRHIDQARYDGVHLFLIHSKDSDRPTFSELKKKSYRAVWLPADVYRQYGKPAFERALNDMLSFEEQWRGSIRPNLNSPLLLPEGVFQAARHASAVWERARTVHARHDDLRHVANVISRFRDTHHRRPHHWIDERQLVFRQGAYHASHVSDWRKRKLTFDFPAGFHFDVEHERSRPFTLHTRDGSHDFNQYTNVDPHGYARGGS